MGCCSSRGSIIRGTRRDPNARRASITLQLVSLPEPTAAPAQVKPQLLVIDSPLLDISVDDPELAAQLVSKYQLVLGSSLTASAAQLPLFDELLADPRALAYAGGSGLNTSRVAAWASRGAVAVHFVGAAADDDRCALLKTRAERDGVDMQLQIKAGAGPTGCCAVCVVNRERALCAQYGASEAFDPSAVDAGLMAQADVIYTTAFMLINHDVGVRLIQAAAELKRTTRPQLLVCLNLSATFIMKKHAAAVQACVPLVDFIIGNDDEAAAFAEMMGFPAQPPGEPGSDDDAAAAAAQRTAQLLGFARATAALPKLTPGPRTVIFTAGKRPAVFARGTEEHGQVAPRAVDKSKIVDSNGCGDSACAGILVSLLSAGIPLEEAVANGHACAGLILQHKGCSWGDDASPI